jgi:AcrR family transcriptional regulator
MSRAVLSFLCSDLYWGVGMSPVKASQTARERARAELTREIKEEARRQLAEAGGNGLSLRAVARELGMVSSAPYRYFSSRDDLLTALIIDAYDAVGKAAEDAVAADSGAGRQWAAAWHAIRGWALAHPHEYALIYGSPVPGYRAPEATIGPASRVPLALISVLAGAAANGTAGVRLAPTVPGAPGAPDPPDGETRLGGELAGQATALAAALAASGAPAVPADLLVRAVIAWTQLFGIISWELFGQFVGSFEPADALFGHAVAQMAAYVGLA